MKTLEKDKARLMAEVDSAKPASNAFHLLNDELNKKDAGIKDAFSSLSETRELLEEKEESLRIAQEALADAEDNLLQSKEKIVSLRI